MDENTLQSLKTLLSTDSNLVSEITSKLTTNSNQNSTKDRTDNNSANNNTIEIIKYLLPNLNEKSKRTADYILAAIRISEIIKEIKNKYS